MTVGPNGNWYFRSLHGIVGVALQWRNKGINGTRPTVIGQHIGVLLGDLAHVEGRCWGGLIILLNIHPVHRSRTGQVQLFKGAVALECQRYLDIVLTVGATGFGQPSQAVCGSQVASEKQLGADHPTLFKRDVQVQGVFQDERILGYSQHSDLQAL
jgi:hypothetical protein